MVACFWQISSNRSTPDHPGRPHTDHPTHQPTHRPICPPTGQATRHGPLSVAVWWPFKFHPQRPCSLSLSMTRWCHVCKRHGLRFRYLGNGRCANPHCQWYFRNLKGSPHHEWLHDMIKLVTDGISQQTCSLGALADIEIILKRNQYRRV